MKELKKFKKIFYLGEEFIIERGKAIPEDGELHLESLKSHGSIAEGQNFSGFFDGKELDFRVTYEDGRPVEIRVYNVDDLNVSDYWSSSDTYYPVDDFLDFNPEERELKPFDCVLARDFDSEEWRIDIYSHRDDKSAYKHQCLMSSWHQCIPYEGNEHLLGTTGDVE